MGILGDLASTIGGLIGVEKGRKELKGALRRILKESVPTFDYRELSPEALLEIARFVPTEYVAAITGAPELPAPSPEGREALLRSLAALEALGQEGLTPEALELANVRRELAALASGLTERGLSALEERGITGGRAGLGARLAAQQAAMEAAHGLGSNIAQSVLARNLATIAQRGMLGRELYSQDLARDLARMEAINRFNEWASELRTRAALESARSQERARMQQELLRQQLAEENARMRMAYQQENLERLNRLRQQDWANRFARAQAAARQQTMLGDYLGGRWTDVWATGLKKGISGLEAALYQLAGMESSPFSKLL